MPVLLGCKNSPTAEVKILHQLLELLAAAPHVVSVNIAT